MDNARVMLKKCHISGFADEIDANLDKQISLLTRLGVKWVEMRSADGINVADFSVEKAQEVKAKLDAAGIQVSAVGSPIGKIDITADFEPHFEKFKHVMEIAKILDTRYIRMFSFFIPQGEDPAIYKDAVMERMDRMVEAAAASDIVLLHENEKDIYGDTAPRCLELMQRFYGPHFACTFDFANFVQCKQDTKKAYELLKPYISYVHVKDALWEDGSVVPAGCGDGNVSRIFVQLDFAGYEGFLSLEPHLADFAGLKDLEKNAAKRGMSDGEKAFTIAHEALEELLG